MKETRFRGGGSRLAGLDHQQWAVIVSLVLMSLSFLFLLDWADPSLRHGENPSLHEARSILNGRIALAERVHDAAVHRGRAVNVFQPGQTIFFLVHLLLAGESFLSVFQGEMFAVFVLSVLLCSLALLRLSRGRVAVSTALVASLMFGAPYIASLRLALFGSMYRVNHCLSILPVFGLLILLENEPTRRRPILMGASIGVAMLFRAQNVLLMVLPLSYLLQDPEGRSWKIARVLSTAEGRKTLMHEVFRLALLPTVALVIIGAFQWARFGNPLQTGYELIYKDRDDFLAERFREHGMFSLHYMPENLSRVIWALPTIKMDGWRIDTVFSDPKGNSLLFTQPILLIGILLVRGLLAARAQAFGLASLVLALPVWFYHNPGYYGPGYNRLSLDYLPLWIASIAVLSRYAGAPRYVRWVSLGLCVFSIAYGLILLLVGVSL